MLNSRIKDLSGQRFGKLVVSHIVQEFSPKGGVYWCCNCDCGKTTIVSAGHLTTGHTRSCGCLVLETITKHGYSRTPEYVSWKSMINRCYSSKIKVYPDYGGRGIRVCDRWRDSFPAFLEDMGKCPQGFTLERINNNGDYSPENCKWASRKEQQRNRRASRTFLIGNRVGCVAEIAEIFKVSYSALRARVFSYGGEGLLDYIAFKCGDRFSSRLIEWNKGVL